MTWVPPEIGLGYREGGVLLVGRDPGQRENELGRPFVGPAGQILDECLLAAGIRREDVAITNIVGRQPPNNIFQKHNPGDVEQGLIELSNLVTRLKPNIIVALGNEAAFATVGSNSWSSKRGIFGAMGITERRGYFWEGSLGVKVMTALHPSGIARKDQEGADSGGGFGINAAIGKMLLTYDLERAWNERHYPYLNRPKRDVRVVATAHDAQLASKEIRASRLLGVDIENSSATELACVGFAISEEVAYVFTPNIIRSALELLLGPTSKCFHNGQYDCCFLLTRYQTRVNAWRDDTSIGFHCNWPELAGAAEGGGKRTHKSLRFLASLHTKDIFWKDYDFPDEEAKYILNGKDCCITLSVEKAIREERASFGTEAIYRHEMNLLWPLIMIEERGLNVDEKARLAALDALNARGAALFGRLVALAQPLLEAAREKVSKPNLFWRRKVCRECRNGKRKRLGCTTCGGAGASEEFSFNPNSNDQVKILLYEVLKLPRRYLKGKLTTDESALKGLLGTI